MHLEETSLKIYINILQ